MNILLIQDQEEVRGRLVFWLENTFGTLVKEATSVERAIDILAKSGLPLPHADQATAGSPAAAKGPPADERAKPGLEGKQKP